MKLKSQPQPRRFMATLSLRGCCFSSDKVNRFNQAKFSRMRASRMRDSSSRYVTSRHQWHAFSMPQWLRTAWANRFTPIARLLM